MAFVLRQEQLKQITKIALQAGKDRLTSDGLDPSHIFAEECMNGAQKVIETCRLLAQASALPLSDTSRTTRMEESASWLQESSQRKIPSIDNETIQLAAKMFEKYFSPVAEYASEDAREKGNQAWQQDKRSNGRSYEQVEEAVMQLVEQAAATAVIKYLDTLGWQHGNDATPPPPSIG